MYSSQVTKIIQAYSENFSEFSAILKTFTKKHDIHIEFRRALHITADCGAHQTDASHRCQKTNLHHVIMTNENRCFRCDDPRCSFECFRRQRRREAKILRRYYSESGRGKVWFKGCFKLTRDCPIHYDYIGWATGADFDRIKKLFAEAASESGFEYASCTRITTPAQFEREADYVYKRYFGMGKKKKFQYLPALKNVRLIDGTRGFFAGTTKEKLWAKEIEAAKEQASQVSPTNNSPSVFHDMHDCLDSDLDLPTKIRTILPQSANEAIPIGKLAWLTGLHDDDVTQIITGNPDISWHEGRLWHNTGVDDPPKWEDRWFPHGVPYHHRWFPIEPDYEAKCEEVVKEYDLDAEIILDEQDFLQELLDF